MAESTNPRRIYDIARYCNDGFQRLVSQNGDPAIEEYQQRFWAWANSLAVFAKPYISLDVRLAKAKYQEIRDIILLLLGVLKKNLDFEAGSAATEPKLVASSSLSAKAGPEPDAARANPALRSAKTDLSAAIYGVDGAISRLEKLARAISAASKESVSQRVLAYAENKRDEEFEQRVRIVVQHLYPPERVPPDLAKTLVESVLFRYYRISYQRRHHRKEMSTFHSSPHPTETPGTILPNDTNYAFPEERTESVPETQRLGQIDRADNAKSETVPHSINMDAFRTKMYQQSEKPTDQATSAPLTGKILYPKPPTPDEHGNLKCPICYTDLPRSKLESKRGWKDHVDEDLEPYVCISENCAESLRFFTTPNSWLQHMKQAHTTNWIRHLHNTVSWVCTIQHRDSEKDETSFDSYGDLIKHMSTLHSHLYKQSELEAMAKRSEVRQPRDVNKCPLCGDRHRPDGQVTGDDEPEEEVDAQNKATRESANHARVAPFVGKHLKSLAFFVLHKLLDEPEEEDGDDDRGLNDDRSLKRVEIGSDRPSKSGDSDSALSVPSAGWEIEGLPGSEEPLENVLGLVKVYRPVPIAYGNDMYELLMQNLPVYNPRHDHIRNHLIASQRKVFILVLGQTGAGKSTFINNVLGSSETVKHVKVGHMLVSFPGTGEITAVSTEIDGHQVTLIDTPGFDHAVHNDARILMDVALWLRGAHVEDRLLNGVVYLHPITDPRMRAGGVRSLQILRKICGRGRYSNIALATTKWSEVYQHDGKGREEALKYNFWRDIIELGGRVYRHDDGERSARRIVTDMLPNRGIALMFQKELEGRDVVADTDAGAFVVNHMTEQVKKLQDETSDLRQRIKGFEREMAEEGMRAAELLEARLEEAYELLREITGEINTMHADMKVLRTRIAELSNLPAVATPDQVQFTAKVARLLTGGGHNQDVK